MIKNADIELFEKVQNRDSRAFNELMRHYSPELNSFILRMVSNVEDAQDILQDTFVKVWEKSHQFRGASSVKTWIFRIAINLAYSHLKRRKRWGFSLIDELKILVSDSEPEREAEHEFHSALLEKSLELLTPRQQAVVMARIYEDLPFAQIASAIGCSENAAKVHFHEGKKRMEKYIEERVS